MVKRRKQKISSSERARRRRQALINFGKFKKSKRRVKNMVRRRKTRRMSRGRFSNNKSLTMTAVGGVGYGAVRGYINQLLAPIASKIPFGQYADEATAILALEVAKRSGLARGNLMNNVLTAGQLIEFASLGQALVSGSQISQSNGATSFVATLG